MPQRPLKNKKTLSIYFVFLPAYIFLVEIGKIVFKKHGRIFEGYSYP